MKIALFLMGCMVLVNRPVVADTLAITQAGSHFVIFYDDTKVSNTLASEILSAFDKAYHLYTQTWGFKEPDFMKDRKLKVDMFSVLTLELEEEGESAGALFYWSKLNSWIELKIQKSGNIKHYSRAIFHEVFHAIQRGYSRFWSTWITEATADAMVDEVSNDLKLIPEYVSEFIGNKRELAIRQNRYLRCWQKYGLFYIGDEDSCRHSYSSSIFFSYLMRKSERIQKTETIRKIWEELAIRPRAADSSILETVFGGRENFQNALHEFSVGLFGGSKVEKPFTFQDSRIPIAPDRNVNSVKAKEKLSYLVSFNRQTGEIIPKEYFVQSYGVKYINFLDLGISTAKSLVGKKHPLSISIVEADPQLKFRALFIRTRKQTIVETKLFEPKNNIIKIPEFIRSNSNTGESQEVYLIVSNPAQSWINFKINAFGGELPYIKKIKVTDISEFSYEKVIYEGEWRQDPNNEYKRIFYPSDRFLELSTEVWPLNRKLRIDILASKRLSKTASVRLENQIASLNFSNIAQGGVQHTAELGLTIFKDEKTLSLDILGGDDLGNELDGNPVTVPVLGPNSWQGYEKSRTDATPVGGKDTYEISIREKKAELQIRGRLHGCIGRGWYGSAALTTEFFFPSDIQDPSRLFGRETGFAEGPFYYPDLNVYATVYYPPMDAPQERASYSCSRLDKTSPVRCRLQNAGVVGSPYGVRNTDKGVVKVKDFKITVDITGGKHTYESKDEVAFEVISTPTFFTYNNQDCYVNKQENTSLWRDKEIYFTILP